MQKRMTTTLFRYNILIIDGVYYIVDLFSNIKIIFLPVISVLLERKGYCISEKKIPENFITTKRTKPLGLLPIIVIYLIGDIIIKIFERYTQLRISMKDSTIIVFCLLIVEIIIVIYGMIDSKRKMNTYVKLEECETVLIKNAPNFGFSLLVTILGVFFTILIFLTLIILSYASILEPSLVNYFLLLLIIPSTLVISSGFGPSKSYNFIIEKIENK